MKSLHASALLASITMATSAKTPLAAFSATEETISWPWGWASRPCGNTLTTSVCRPFAEHEATRAPGTPGGVTGGVPGGGAATLLQRLAEVDQLPDAQYNLGCYYSQGKRDPTSYMRNISMPDTIDISWDSYGILTDSYEIRVDSYGLRWIPRNAIVIHRNLIGIR